MKEIQWRMSAALLPLVLIIGVDAYPKRTLLPAGYATFFYSVYCQFSFQLICKCVDDAFALGWLL
jgi:hypothetical protein